MKIIKQLAAEFQIKLAAKAVNSSSDACALLFDICAAVKSRLIHNSSLLADFTNLFILSQRPILFNKRRLLF